MGSGAGGGTVTKVLTDLGINVTLLEAGPMLNPMKDFKEHVWPYQVDHRGAGPHAETYFGKSPWGFSYFTAPAGNRTLEGVPIHMGGGGVTTGGGARHIGGRADPSRGNLLRFSRSEFKTSCFSGTGHDW